MTPACNLCGSTEFQEMNGRANAYCARCGSYERTRVMKLALDRLGVPSEAAILHLAPERGLSEWLRSQSRNYLAADIDPATYPHIPDIVSLDLCDSTALDGRGPFDLIVHSHVIEHVPCNWTAVMLRLHRRLKPGGFHVFSMPIFGLAYEEDLSALSGEARAKRFGQFDHCRRFSPTDLGVTLGAVFRFPETYDLVREFGESSLRAANIPEAAWRGYSGHSVFVIAREDALL
ncbi:MAG: methyltransferase domain-containing protein [Parvularculaceae bacterium]